jgi:hypothetical protein
MNSKHHAVWAVVVLLVVFLGILMWYLLGGRAPESVVPPADTTDGQATSTTPFASEPISIVENTQYYELEGSYPNTTPLTLTAGTEANAAAVARLQGFVRENLATFKANNDLANMTPDRIETEMLIDGRVYATDLEYKLHEGPKTITYVYQIYENTLGAHPNTYYRTFTFDRATGAELSLADLFTPGSSYLMQLSERTRAALPGIMAKMAELTESDVDMAYIFDGTKAEAASFQSFAIDGSNLIVIFPPYQVAPYVYGRIDVSIHLPSLSGILKEQYRP